MIANGKCNCGTQHTFNSGTLTSSIEDILSENKLTHAAELIEALVIANKNSPFYGWLDKRVSNNFVQVVKSCTFERKEKIFRLLDKVGKNAVITDFAERLGMTEVVEALSSKTKHANGPEQLREIQHSNQAMLTVPVLPPKPLAILPKQAPPKLLNRVSPTVRSPLMGSNTQPAPSILFNARTRDGVGLLEPPNATTELSFSANRYGFI